MTTDTLEPSLLDRWRQRLGGRRRRANPRPLAALGYLVSGPLIDDLVEIDRLTTVALYDEPIRPGHCALRLAGYSSSRVSQLRRELAKSWKEFTGEADGNAA